MNIEFAIEYTKVEEKVSTGGCDYCDKPEGRRFVRYDAWEWVNQTPERKFRSVKTGGDDWDSKYDNQEPDVPITGQQHQVHYNICEKCLLELTEKLYNRVSRYVGNPELWYKKYMDDCNKLKKLRSTQVGVPIGYERKW